MIRTPQSVQSVPRSQYDLAASGAPSWHSPSLLPFISVHPNSIEHMLRRCTRRCTEGSERLEAVLGLEGLAALPAAAAAEATAAQAAQVPCSEETAAGSCSSAPRSRPVVAKGAQR